MGSTLEFYKACVEMRNWNGEHRKYRDASFAGLAAFSIHAILAPTDLPAWQSLFTLAFGAQIIATSTPRTFETPLPRGEPETRIRQINGKLWLTDPSQQIEAFLYSQIKHSEANPTWRYVAELGGLTAWTSDPTTALGDPFTFATLPALKDIVEWQPELCRQHIDALVTTLAWPGPNTPARIVLAEREKGQAENTRLSLLNDGFKRVLTHSDYLIAVTFSGSVARDIGPFRPSDWVDKFAMEWFGNEVAHAAECALFGQEFRPQIAISGVSSEGDPQLLLQRVNLDKRHTRVSGQRGGLKRSNLPTAPEKYRRISELEAKGRPAHVIAARLGISERTLRRYKADMRKQGYL